MTNRQRGLTLVEVLVSSAVLSLVLLGVYMIWGQSQRTYQASQSRATLQAEARQAVSGLIRELRQAQYVALTDAWAVANGESGSTRNSLSFVYPTATESRGVRYAIDPACGGPGTKVCLVRQELSVVTGQVVIQGVERTIYLLAATGISRVVASSLQPGTGFRAVIEAPSTLALGQGATSWIPGPLQISVALTLREPARAGSPQPRDLTLRATSLPRNHR